MKKKHLCVWEGLFFIPGGFRELSGSFRELPAATRTPPVIRKSLCF